VFVCVRERVFQRDSVWERERERERECVCVCVWVSVCRDSESKIRMDFKKFFSSSTWIEILSSDYVTLLLLICRKIFFSVQKLKTRNVCLFYPSIYILTNIISDGKTCTTNAFRLLKKEVSLIGVWNSGLLNVMSHIIP